MKTIRITVYLTFAVLVFVCYALLPIAQGVSPPPDGGYSGGNTAEGQSALFTLTSGAYNTAVGYLSLRSDGAGSFNTAIGAGTLLANTADRNTATGTGALLNNTMGMANTANGTLAAFSNTTGGFNTAAGDNALFSNTAGTENTANGALAMNVNTEGNFNTAIGVAALSSNITGSANTAIGEGAGSNITGDGNVCIGHFVMGTAGANDTTWIRNINTTPQGFISGTNNYVTVRMSDGRLGWTNVVSSRRYKEDIKPMDKASEALLALKPVTFRLKGEIDPTHRPQWGLIAEEVEKVNPDLVDRNNKGEVESVRYDMVNAMLLNEFLKEHRKNEDQQKQINDLTAQLKEQAGQIQKVSAQLAAASLRGGELEVSKRTPQVVNNP